MKRLLAFARVRSLRRPAQTLGEMTRAAPLNNGDQQASALQRFAEVTLVTAGRFQDDELRLQLAQPRDQLLVTSDVVGELADECIGGCPRES